MKRLNSGRMSRLESAGHAGVEYEIHAWIRGARNGVPMAINAREENKACKYFRMPYYPAK
jgi:hypothetical protein